MSEKVLVVETHFIESFFGDDFIFMEDFQDDVWYYKLDMLERIISTGSKFMERTEELEQDDTVLQIIPYCIFTGYRPSDKADVYFVYRRLPKSGEDRLKGKLSIGVGGHINDTTAACFHCDGMLRPNLFAEGAHRELLEETNIKEFTEDSQNLTTFVAVGALRDPKTPVGRVHLGVICMMEMDADLDALTNLKMTEEDIAEAVGWFSIDELVEMENLEDWSCLIIDKLQAIEQCRKNPDPK